VAQIDPYTACGAQGRLYKTGWCVPRHADRRARCNRPQGHDGEHQERDRRTFEVRARFTEVYAGKTALR
jgi:hypothetical protein